MNEMELNLQCIRSQKEKNEIYISFLLLYTTNVNKSSLYQTC